MNYTDDQNKVLENDSTRLLVSASAGSGKTATIIEKIFRIVSVSKVDIEKILCITFTDSASVEMKSRLKDALKQHAQDDKFVLEQFEKLSVADISTLHAFCSKMIKKYFYFLDINPNFVVLDDNNSKFLKANALEKTIKFYSKSSDLQFIEVSSIFDSGRNFDGLKQSILSIYEFLCALENKQEFLDKTAQKLYDEDLTHNEACQFLNDYICSNFNFLRRQIAEQTILANAQKSMFFEGLLNQTKELLSQVDAKNSYSKNAEIVDGLSFPRIATKSFKDENDELFYDTFRDFWDMLKSRVADIKKNVIAKSEDQLKSDLCVAQKSLAKILEIEKNFEENYEKNKFQQNALDFNDLEKNFLKLLDIEDVKKSLKYEYVFVDEYQDINSVQEKIIRALSSQSKVVMVGDIKQSIYGFRNSTPEIFVEKSKSYANNSAQGELVVLSENFRSNPAILNFINNIFETCMSQEFGGVDYSKSGFFKAKIDYEKCSNIPEVELEVINSSKDENEEEEEILPSVYGVLDDKNDYEEELTPARKEGMVVAKKILDIYGKNIYDAKEKVVKQIHFGDIAILCRNNDYLKEVAKVLLDFKVPIATNLVENIFSQNDVQVLLSFLRLLNNFHDDIALATFMTSFLGHFTFDDLAKIRLASPDEEFFYNAVKNYSSSKIADKIIKQKLDDMSAFLSAQKEKLLFSSLFELLTDIGDKTGYFDYLLSLPDGSNRSKIVRDFVQSFCGAKYNYDLVGFLDFVKNYASQNRFKTTFSAGEDSVKMGTIHSSKGLEYPVVFLIGCGKSFSNQSFKEVILKNKDFGFGIWSYHHDTFEKLNNVARSTLNIVTRRIEREEELRLMYVALTRAKNHLFVVGNVNLKTLWRPENADDSKGVTNYFQWIFAGLTHAGFERLKLNNGDFEDSPQKAKVSVKIFDNKDYETQQGSVPVLDFSHYDEELVESLKNMFSFVLPKKKNIALKNSVSSLLAEHAQSVESLNFSPKALTVFESSPSVTSANILGTAYHKVMEQVDFDVPFDEAQFQRIVAKLELDEKTKEEISFEKIFDCVNTLQKLGKIKTSKEVPFISYIPYCDIFGGSEKTRVLVQGVADLIVNAGSKNYLVDYKTTKAQNADQLVEKYKTQLKLYKICLEKALNINFDEVYVYSFVLKKLIKVF